MYLVYLGVEMKDSHRAGAAIAILVIGLFLLFVGATPAPADMIDWAMVIVGAAMAVGYVALIGNSLNNLLKTQSSTAPFMPVLVVLGVLAIEQAIMGGGVELIHKIVLAVLGVVLIIAPVAVLYKVTVKKQ